MPNGQNGNGGHCHNDKLSFELTINNVQLLLIQELCIYSFPKIEINIVLLLIIIQYV